MRNAKASIPGSVSGAMRPQCVAAHVPQVCSSTRKRLSACCAVQALSKLGKKLGDGLSISQDRFPLTANGAH